MEDKRVPWRYAQGAWHLSGFNCELIVKKPRSDEWERGWAPERWLVRDVYPSLHVLVATTEDASEALAIATNYWRNKQEEMD